jgi:hypothetical protein
MKLIKATCEGNIVKTEEGLTIQDIVILSNGRGKSEGFVICEADKWFYITSIVDILNLLELTVKAVSQITTSVANAQAIMRVEGQATGIMGTVQTTIETDLQPIMDEFDKLKENLK